MKICTCQNKIILLCWEPKTKGKLKWLKRLKNLNGTGCVAINYALFVNHLLFGIQNMRYHVLLETLDINQSSVR